MVSQTTKVVDKFVPAAQSLQVTGKAWLLK